MKELRAVLLPLMLTGFAPAAERTWTSREGKTFVGEMVSETEDTVTIRTEKRIFVVPLKHFSDADLEWLAGWRKAEKEKNDALQARNAAAKALAGTSRTFSASDGHPATFHVHYPKTHGQNASLPMLILFSPGGAGKGIMDEFKAACESVGWIAVGCDTFRNGADTGEMDALFGKLLPVIEQNIPHDPQRIYLGGMSGGAARALHYTAKFDRPWKGVISCGGWLANEPDLEYRRGMAVAWVNGDADDNANGWVEKDSGVLESRRCKTKLFSFPGGHVVGPAETLIAAMRWAESNTRKR